MPVNIISLYITDLIHHFQDVDRIQYNKQKLFIKEELFMDEKIFEKQFIERLTQLRYQKNVSARDLSLTLGLNAGYINNIESGKALPSVGTFFLICNYLNISPMEFFDYDSPLPEELREAITNLKKLNPMQFTSIKLIIEDLAKQSKNK